MLVANVFVEKVLPASTIRTLAAEEMDAYRAPYRTPGESRRPTLHLAAGNPDRRRTR